MTNANPSPIRFKATDYGVTITATEGFVGRFIAGWPGCKIEPGAYTFEFDLPFGNLIDTDLPAEMDGPEAAALAGVCWDLFKAEQKPI